MRCRPRSTRISKAVSSVAPSCVSRAPEPALSIIKMTDSTLIAGAAQLGIELSERQAAQLLRLLDELDDWNQRMNLTAIRERGAQITKHLLDSLSIQPFLQGE